MVSRKLSLGAKRGKTLNRWRTRERNLTFPGI